MFNVRDWFTKGGLLRKFIVLAAAFLVFTAIAFLLIQSGLTVLLILAALGVAFIIALVLAYRFFKKTQYVNLMEEAYLMLYRSTQVGVIPVEMKLIIKLHENATIESPGGFVRGRTMLPVDESVNLIKEMGEPAVVKRKVYTEDNKTEVIEEDNLLWVFRVQQPTQFGGKQVLCIIADSQISELSRDATGDLQMGGTILAYGHWIQLGKFYVLWNRKEVLERTIKGVKTVAVMIALEHYVNKLAQITVMDTKTNPDILKKKEVQKHEEDAMAGN